MKTIAAFLVVLIAWVVLSFALWIRQAHAATTVCTQGKAKIVTQPDGTTAIVIPVTCTTTGGR